MSFFGPSDSNCTINHYVVEWQPLDAGQSGAGPGQGIIQPFVSDAYMQIEDRFLGIPKMPHVLLVDSNIYPGITYRITVYGVSSMGNGASTAITVTTTPVPTSRPSSTSADLEIGLALGLGLGIMLLLLLVDNHMCVVGHCHSLHRC